MPRRPQRTCRMHRQMPFILAFLSAFLLASSPLLAADSVRSPRAEVRLVSEFDAIQAGQEFWVAWHFRLAPKWHTYWINPGDSGETLRVTWRENPGLRAGPLQYPFPRRIELPPLANFGYSGEVLILAKIQASSDLQAGDVLKVGAHATWLVCEEECIPEKGDFEIELPVKAEALPSAAWQEKIRAAEREVPRPWPGKAPLLENLPQGPALKISGAEAYFQNGTPADFFPSEQGLIQNAFRPLMEKSASGLLVQLKPGEIQKGPLPSLRGVLTGTDSAGRPAAYQVQAGAAPAAGTAPSLWIFVWAFLGGLLLNLMPCVFPVLSLKVLGFFHQGGRSPAKARGHAAAYAAGILVSFWVLAGVMGLLRWTGRQVGWGFQLQSPTFTLLLIALLFLLGLSLLGVFSFGGSWMNWGASLTQGRGYGSSFFGGVLATVVATPCMAPMVGSSLGLALTQSSFVAWLIFTALGLGLASPYLVLGFFPRALSWLPKPGAWMQTFERVMGFLLLAAVVWLLGVYLALTSPGSLIWLMAGLLGLSFALWFPSSSKGGKALRAAFALACLILAWKNISVETSGAAAHPAGPGAVWENFSEARLAELRASGRPVFVDFTAAWCLTCQVNKRVALRADSVQKAFAEKNVALLVADWTRQDAEIARTLESYGRQGVPLYLLFGKNPSQAPEILPELLNPGIVLQALEKI